MFCPKCGDKNDEGATFCANCGNPLSVSPPSMRPEPQRTYPPPQQTYPESYRPPTAQPSTEQEKVLAQEAAVKSYASESPKAGWNYQVGSLIVTDQRLVFVSKGKRARAALLGMNPIVDLVLEKSVTKAGLDDLAKSADSHFIPLSAITNVEVARKWGGANMRVEHPGYSDKPVHSYIFGSGFSVNKGFVDTLNSARAVVSKGQMQFPTPSPFIPTPSAGTKFCSQCGQQIQGNAKFCSKCGTPQV